MMQVLQPRGEPSKYIPEDSLTHTSCEVPFNNIDLLPTACTQRVGRGALSVGPRVQGALQRHELPSIFNFLDAIDDLFMWQPVSFYIISNMLTDVLIMPQRMCFVDLCVRNTAVYSSIYSFIDTINEIFINQLKI